MRKIPWDDILGVGGLILAIILLGLGSGRISSEDLVVSVAIIMILGIVAIASFIPSVRRRFSSWKVWAVLLGVPFLALNVRILMAFEPAFRLNCLLALLVLIGTPIGAIYFLSRDLQFDRSSTVGRAPFRFGKDTLFYLPDGAKGYCKLTRPGAGEPNWRTCDLGITTTYAAVYTNRLLGQETLTFNPENMRWLGQPHRYSDTESEIWLDLEIDLQWYVLRLRLDKNEMKRWVDSIETILPDSLRLERNRRRPNLRHKPVRAFPAAQDVDGSWTLDEPILLYLTPLYLVVLQDGYVQRSILLDTIKEIKTLKVPDQQRGLVQFESGGEVFAFANKNHVALAELLGNAAKEEIQQSTFNIEQDNSRTI